MWDASASDGEDVAVAPSDGASSCRPGDVQTYVPSAYRPATAAWQGVCVAVAGQDAGSPIQLFYDACLGPGASKDACTTFTQTYPACAACILTPATADQYGPVIGYSGVAQGYGGFVQPNVAGCIELTDPSKGLSCAKAVQALSGCELEACEANCPVHDSASLDAYGQCAREVDGAGGGDAAPAGGCQSYATKASCRADEADSSASTCLSPSFKAYYDFAVPLFCGAQPTASPDAGMPQKDATTD
jgi:hypothetical protein